MTDDTKPAEQPVLPQKKAVKPRPVAEFERIAPDMHLVMTGVATDAPAPTEAPTAAPEAFTAPKAVEMTPAPIEVKITPPEPVKSAPAASAVPEWADTTGLELTNLLYKMPPDVVAKMNWAIRNVPQMSRQRIVREGVDMFLNSLIEKHYKP